MGAFFFFFWCTCLCLSGNCNIVIPYNLYPNCVNRPTLAPVASPNSHVQPVLGGGGVGCMNPPHFHPKVAIHAFIF